MIIVPFTSQSSKQTGHRVDPIQCSGSGAGAVVAVATAAAAFARATSSRPRAGPATTGGAAFSGSVGASPRAAASFTRRLHVALWSRAFQSTTWHALEQYGVLHSAHRRVFAGNAAHTEQRDATEGCFSRGSAIVQGRVLLLVFE